MQKDKNKKGASAYYFFIQEHLEKLRLAHFPYEGANASEDFLELWLALSIDEQEQYNKLASSK